LIAVWALAALYLALGPSLSVTLLGASSQIAGGLVILALMGAGAVRIHSISFALRPRNTLSRPLRSLFSLV
jgi:hypothetical protein